MEIFKKFFADDSDKPQEVAECVHMYDPTTSRAISKEELPMEPGNKIIVLKKDKGEWYGKNGRKKGWFPANRVKIIKK